MPIDDMVKTFESKDVEVNIRNIESYIKQMTIKIKENADNVKNDKSVILQQIRCLRTELNDKLQKLEDDLIATLKGYYKTEDLNLQTQEARGRSLITAIDSDLTHLDLVMTHVSEVQKVIMLRNIEKNQNSYFKAISEYQEDIKYIKFGLDVNASLKDLMNDLNAFGQIKVILSKPNLPPCPVVTTSQLKAEIVSGSLGTPLKNRKAVKISEFSVNISGDTTCYISDVLTLQGMKHILVDYNNSKIKVYGENYQFLESMPLQGKPWNACILPNNNMAVTVPFKKTIQIIGMKNTMHKVRKVRTRLRCWGIAVLKDQLVITTFSFGHSNLILDMNGVEIKSVRPDNYQSENLLDPRYVNVNQTETVIYISYYSGDRMVAFDTSWNTLFTYANRELRNSYGLDTDREGIFTCVVGIRTMSNRNQRTAS